MLGFYSALLHVSSVYISQHQVRIGSQKDNRGKTSPNKQWPKFVNIMEQRLPLFRNKGIVTLKILLETSCI